MSDVMIFVASVDSPTEPDPQGQIRFEARAYHAQGAYCVFNCYANFADPPNQMNAAIRDAAVVACALEGITIAPGDKKTLFGGAINI